METLSGPINLRKVAAKYALRRGNTLKDPFNDSAAQQELLAVIADGAQSLQRANKILDV